MDLNCKNCQYWKSTDRKQGFCGMVEDNRNKSFSIVDETAYRPQLETDHKFYCNLHILHENVPGQSF